MKQRILIGTWQFGGDFGGYPIETARSVIVTALKMEYCRFDTAIVYGGGSVEELLGDFCDQNIQVVTKIPSVTKPTLVVGSEAVLKFYPRDHVTKNVYHSCQRLNQTNQCCVLLHNWSKLWDADVQPIKELIKLRNDNLVKSIGISLPDKFEHRLSEDLCKIIDVIEAPFNHIEFWIKEDIDYYKNFGIEIILRSLFAQGLRLKTDSDRLLLKEDDKRRKKLDKIPYEQNSNVRKIFHDVLSLNTSITFGVSSVQQLLENTQIIEEYKDETK